MSLLVSFGAAVLLLLAVLLGALVVTLVRQLFRIWAQTLRRRRKRDDE